MTDPNETDVWPEPSDEEIAALLALSIIDGIGPAALLETHRGPGAPATLAALRADRPGTVPVLAERLARRERWQATVEAVRRCDGAKLLDAHRRYGSISVLDRRGYPLRLGEDPAPPVLLFGRGDLELLDGPTVAIVGTRSATGLGRDLAFAMGRDLSLAGVAVISGLAMGIDAAAHGGALAGHRCGGRAPVGVVASGLDIAYPRRHLALHREVADVGLLLSETPLGERPTRWRFPARNRIIAALSDAVVVVESRASGGSMHTAEEALERSRPLLAVPGHPLGPATEGTNGLLADGALMARDANDVLGALGLVMEVDRGGDAPSPARPEVGIEGAVLRVLADGPASLTEVVERCREPIDELAAVLLRLEVEGRLSSHGGWFELRGGTRAGATSSSRAVPAAERHGGLEGDS